MPILNVGLLYLSGSCILGGGSENESWHAQLAFMVLYSIHQVSLVSFPLARRFFITADHSACSELLCLEPPSLEALVWVVTRAMIPNIDVVSISVPLNNTPRTVGCC